MRALVDRERIRLLMIALGAAGDLDARVYFTGGVTGVLHGWRASTIDVDLKIPIRRSGSTPLIDGTLVRTFCAGSTGAIAPTTTCSSTTSTFASIQPGSSSAGRTWR
jgi:hypothetical protein